MRPWLPTTWQSLPVRQVHARSHPGRGLVDEGLAVKSTYHLHRISSALSLLALFMFGGTVVELVASKHYDELTQFIPFLMCGLGVALTVLAWQRLSLRMVRVTQGYLWLALAISLLGMYFHVRANIAFLTDFRPGATWQEQLKAGFQGRDPILAPGMLFLAALVGLLGTLGRRVVIAEGGLATT